jgi:hypothetical protein
MKTQLTALALSAVTALSFSPKPVQASDKGLAILGGFIGGIIVASALNDSHHDGYYADRPTAVVVNDSCDDRGPFGYWSVVAVQVWVPGCWVESRDYYGCRTRRYVSGHYECRNDRVWVSKDRHGRYDRDDRGRHEHEVSSGYGHDRNHR